MKVCLISSEFLPVWGGVGRYTVELAKNLPKNVDLHVVSVLRKRRQTNGSSFDHLFGDNVTVHFLAEASSMLSAYPKLQIGCLKAIPQLNREHDFDIIHTQFPTMPDIFLRLLKIERTNSVCTIHSTMRTQLDSIRRAKTTLYRMDAIEKVNVSLFSPMHFFERRYLDSFKNFITVSEFVRKEALNDFEFLQNRNVVTIHHGVDTERYSPGQGKNQSISDSQVVLFTGRLVTKKGPHILINAIPRVLKEVPDAKFVFAGEGDSSGLRALARDLNVPDERIVFLGYVGEDKLPKLYRSCDVFVSPSLEDSLGIRMLEAMSSGKPVIATSIGGVPEIITDYVDGILVQPTDVLGLSEAIVRVLEDQSLRKKLSHGARERVEEKFSVERMIEKTMEMYRNVLTN